MNLHSLINAESIHIRTVALSLFYSRILISNLNNAATEDCITLVVVVLFLFFPLLSFKLLYRDFYALPQIFLDYIHSLMNAEYVGTRIITTAHSIL